MAAKNWHGNDGMSKQKSSHAGSRKYGYLCFFSPFLCLPVILKVKWSPKPPKPPQLPSRETLGDSTQLRFLPRLSCGRHSQSQGCALRFQNLNIPKWSFQKRAPVGANASAVQLWGRQWGTRGGGGGVSGKTKVNPNRSTPCWWVHAGCDVNKCSSPSKRFINRCDQGQEYEFEVWAEGLAGLQVSDLLRSSVSWPHAGGVLSRIRSTSNWGPGRCTWPSQYEPQTQN